MSVLTGVIWKITKAYLFDKPALPPDNCGHKKPDEYKLTGGKTNESNAMYDEST